MKIVFRGVSGAALLLGLGGLPVAWGQQTSAPAPTAPQNQTVTTTSGPQVAPQTTAGADQTAGQPGADASERVVVIGSLIATSPEDAPKPVEVITADDLKKQGSPNITEFIRSLTSALPNATGVASTTTGAGVLANGFVNIDLRGQGSNGTLVLMNGRRLATTNGGAGADVNTVPIEALQAVEILKDGASATYGAGAVGGVVNFRTRRDIDAPQISVSKTFYEGSDGAWNVNFLTGWVGDASNVMISLTHEEEASMLGTEREFSTLPYDINPDGWSLGNLPQRFHKWTNWQTASTVAGSTNDFTSNADCAVLGGALVQDLQHGTGGTVPTACAFPLANVSELVSQFTQDRIYGEFNADITDTMEFHFDTVYSKYESTGRRPPSSGVATARAMDSGVSAFCASSCYYLVPGRVQTYTTAGAATGTFVTNPFIADYNARQPGTTADIGINDALLTSSQWRPYLFGGNPLFGYDLAESKVQRERLQFNAGFKGEFAGESLLGRMLNGVTYDIAGQFNQYIQTNVANPDWLVNRLQDAMMGYGGPGCNAIDRVRTDYSSAAAFNRTIGIQSDTAPGTNGCMWFNPFQSNFQTSIFSGAANPNYNFGGSASPTWGAGATQGASTGPAGFLNNLALVDWIWADRRSEVTYNSGTFDAVFAGQIPESMFTLPGGEVGWALGGQWRMTERRGAIDAPDEEEHDLLLQECPYSHAGQSPQGTVITGQTSLYRGCAGANGTGNFFSGVSPLQPNPGLDPPDYVDSQTLAYFGELQLPVLDNVNLTASLRREEFNGGDVGGTIWGTAGKWDITDNFYVRASYSTNFRAEAALDAVPGAVTTSLVTDNTRFGTGFQYLRITTTQDVSPEDDRTLNVGVGYQGELFGGRLRASADYFKIDIRESVVTTSATRVLDNVFYETSDKTNDPSLGNNPDDVNAGSPAHRADCSARLIAFVRFSSGACVQGTSTAANIVGIDSAELNGPGFLTEGVDYSLDYTHDLFDGIISFSTNITQNLTYEATPYSVNGVLFDAGGDRLGFRNTLQTGSASQKLRGNASIRWSNEEHSIGLRANYQDGYMLDPGSTRTPIINLAGTANDVFSGYGWGKKDYIDYDLTYIYTAPFWEELELRLSVLNLTDRNPPPDQSAGGFIAQMGNPRGRRIEIGATKKF